LRNTALEDLIGQLWGSPNAVGVFCGVLNKSLFWGWPVDGCQCRGLLHQNLHI